MDALKDMFFGFLIGFSVGAAVMWIYFGMNGLIRSRSEWYGIRKAQGKQVPDDWDDPEKDY